MKYVVVKSKYLLRTRALIVEAALISAIWISYRSGGSGRSYLYRLHQLLTGKSRHFWCSEQQGIMEKIVGR